MNYDYPELSAHHLANAKLYATRRDLMAALPVPRGGTVAEVGVELGIFSKFLVGELRPRSFHAFDLFNFHTKKLVWGQETRDLLRGMTHLDYYRSEMESIGSAFVIHEGLSQHTLRGIPDYFFDMIYVDAGHSYEDVKADADLAARKVKPHGILVFNDYVLYDLFAKVEYGVVPVVNELVQNQGWKIVGFALQRHMFCDIAIAR
jgi:hypothetical protein